MLASVLRKEINLSKHFVGVVSVVLFATLTAAGAFIRIPLPFTPVPLTMQTFFVLLAGLMLGARRATFSQVSYIALGVFGVPIFASGLTGMAYLIGPTGGYLFGFVLAAFFLGVISRRMNSSFYIYTAAIIASVMILLCGSTWLAIGFKLSLAKAFYLGFIPFIAGDILKSIVAATVFIAFFKK